MQTSFKHPFRELEKKRGVFLRTGLMISLLITFVAFEWRTAVPVIEIPKTDAWEFVDTEAMPVTRIREEMPPAAPLTENKFANEPTPVDPIVVPNDRPVTLLPDSLSIIPVTATPEPEPEPEPWLFVEIMPQFPGGEKALMRFLYHEIRYPEAARKAGMDGTVHVCFVIDENGNLTELACLRSPGEILTREAFRVIEKMPRWKPGIQGGERVRVKMTLPINFKLIM